MHAADDIRGRTPAAGVPAQAGELTLDDTFALKGIALILLLTHHLFYIDNGLYDDFTLFGVRMVHAAGEFSKVCVALFVFLSGYGIVRSGLTKGFLPGRFLRKGMTKLYMNYWVMWLLFVPAGVLLFGRTFAAAYGDRLWIKGAIGWMGLARSACFDSYYSCILLLYALTPLLYPAVRRRPFVVLAIAALFMAFWRFEPVAGPIRYYLFPFVLGMAAAHGGWIPRLTVFAREHRMFYVQLVLVLVFFRSLYLDGVLTLAIVVGYALMRNPAGGGSALLRSFGRHSFNIFLFHTFLFLYYFPRIVYAPRNPLAILVLLLACCMGLSWLIERGKHIAGYYVLEKRIAGAELEGRIRPTLDCKT